MSGKVTRVDHLGIAVRDPRERLEFWGKTLGLELERVEAVESEGVRTWFLDVGGTHLELLEPLSEGSPIARALEKRGEGIHHLALEVEGIEAVLARLAQVGVDAIGEAPRPGAGGCKVAFVHPRHTGGVLLELSEKPRGGEPQGVAGGLGAGEVIVLYLKNPKSRIVGVLEHLDAAGVVVEGVDLAGWDDLIGQCSRQEDGPVGPTREYYPMLRVEKILVDRDAGDLPSLQTQFSDRTGLSLREVLGGGRDRSHGAPD